MKISIIVPVYNVEKYINRCFDSIINQTYKNIECIVVDDASPDNCHEIINQRIAEYSGEIDFRIIQHRHNKGLSGARNTGTIAAKGDYIYYLDSDDEIMVDCIQHLVDLAKKYICVEIVQGNTKTLPEPKSDWRDIRLKNYPEYADDPIWIKKHCFSKPRIPVNAWNKLIKKIFLIDNNLFFREGIIHEDEHWMFFVAKKLKSIAFTEQYCYIHYVVPESIMQSGNNYKSLQSCLCISKELSSNVDTNLPILQRKYIYNFISYNMLRINPKSNEEKLIRLYRAVIKTNITDAIKHFRIIEFMALAIFFLPHWIFSSFVGRKAFRLLNKLI